MSDGGKGSAQRPTNHANFSAGYDRLFNPTKRICCYCTQSIGTDNDEMYCTLKGQLMDRDQSCEEWERCTGSDDE